MKTKKTQKLIQSLSLLLLAACVRAPLTLAVEVKEESVLLPHLKDTITNHYSDADNSDFYILELSVTPASCRKTDLCDPVWKMLSKRVAHEFFNGHKTEFIEMPNEIFYGQKISGLRNPVPAKPLDLNTSYLLRFVILSVDQKLSKRAVIEGHSRFTLKEYDGVLSVTYQGLFE